MEFEELLENLYIGNLSENMTNNHMYIHLSKDQLLLIKSILEKNPIFEVTRPKRYSSYHVDEKEFETMDNIEVDFSKLNIANLFNYIFYALKINYRIDYLNVKDLLMFIEVLREKDKHLNLHIFNIDSLTREEQTLLNNLLFLNLNGVIMQIYVEDDYALRSEVNSNGEHLEEGVHYQVLSVKEPKFNIKNINRPDMLEKKAS